MKKILVNGVLAVLGLLLAASISFATGTDVAKSCEGTGNVAYVEYFGGGDTAGRVYKNVFTRFVPAQDNAQGFWFYVYEKGSTWLCEGAEEESYENLPDYITIRVYEGNQEEKLRSKYSVYDVGHLLTNAGTFTTFYFNEGGQAHFVLNYFQPDTIILSAPFNGRALADFQVGAPLREMNCGEEKPEFTQLLNAVTLL